MQGIVAPSEGTGIRAWFRGAWRSNLLIFALCADGALWVMIKPGNNPGVVTDLLSIALVGWLGIELWITAKSPLLDAQTRRAWRLCALGQLSFALGNVVFALYTHILHRPTSPSLVDFFFLLYQPFLLFGFLSFPTLRRSRGDAFKLWLDAGIVAVAGGTLVWHLILAPGMAGNTTEPASWLSATIALMYPMGDMILLLAVAISLFARPRAVSRTAIQFAIAGTFVTFAMDVIYSYMVVHRGEFESGGLVNVGYYIGVCFWLLGTRYQRWRAAHAQADDAERLERRIAPASVIPYLAVLAGYALLLNVVRQNWSSSLGQIVAAVFVLTVFVLLRQFTVLRENAQLLGEQMQQEARFRSLVQHSSDVVAIVDGSGVIRFVSPALERVFGWKPGAMTGHPVTALVHPDDADAAMQFIEENRVVHKTPSVGVWRCRNSSGEWRQVETVATCLLDDPAVRGIVLNARDVTERMTLQAELTHQAYHDSLTGLANRAWFGNQVEFSLARDENSVSQLAVFFLDLDNFKNINDSLGHTVGDALLTEVSARLLNATRGSDTVARLGGDEFAVLVGRVTSTQDLIIIAERITNAIRAPFELHGSEVYTSTSIGIARGTAGQTADELLRNADVAMYVSKRQGKGIYTIFESKMHAAASERLNLETEIRQGLMRGEFSLVFQPIVGIDDGHTLGVEALTRWNHPQRGEIQPNDFIPFAEECGLILPLGRWALSEACYQGARWRAMLPPEAMFTVAVNVSGRQLEQPTFVDEVATVLRETGLRPEHLLLEITENVIVRDTEAMLRRLTALKKLGLRLAIDDFGTGYSSLGFLRRFPIDVLKIDKSFVDGLGTGMDNGNAAALARTIVALGQTLLLETVAEGVEAGDQADALAAMGCVVAQGFHFARPVASGEIDTLIKSGNAGSASRGRAA